ncbi:MAG TPA: nuclear transport factor 2 family protein [Ktedonosporobacter sp.]|nr:nuclear transport factor 2 family protein [Ktedonosporobacter sp.]
MYKAIVRRKVRAGFRALSAGDYEQLLRQFHPQVLFSFAGPAPLGGERRGIEDVRAWFQRLNSDLPGIQFTVHDVIVQGWPWNTLVATRLSIAAPRADGSFYRNEAMQFVRLRWGKVIEDRLHEDTYKLVNELQARQEFSQSSS